MIRILHYNSFVLYIMNIKLLSTDLKSNNMEMEICDKIKKHVMYI